MRTLVMCLILVVLPLAASAQPWGSAPFDIDYAVSYAFDGNPATWWEGRCHPALQGGCGARPLTAAPWALGQSFATAQAVTAITATHPNAAFTPGTVTPQCSTDPATPNAEGSNLTGWVTWTPGAVCRHVRLLMTAAPGEGPGQEYPPAVSELTVVLNPALTLPPPPPPPPVAAVCVPPLGEVPAMSLAAIGDSITALGWPELLAFWQPALIIYNHGHGGDTSAQMLARFSATLATGAGIITIGPCCWNDAAAGIPADTTAANVRAMIEQAQEAGRVVMLLGPTPGGQGVSLTPLRVAMLALARETCPLYVPLWNALNNPDAPGSMLGTLRAEGAHPNAEGLRRIAERVAHAAGW